MALIGLPNGSEEDDDIKAADMDFGSVTKIRTLGSYISRRARQSTLRSDLECDWRQCYHKRASGEGAEAWGAIFLLCYAAHSINLVVQQC
jgi:hypothetical protein